MSKQVSTEKYAVWGVFLSAISIIGFIATIAWCCYLGGGTIERSSLAFVLCSASFVVGSVLGFMFTIFGDEQEPFGKIRDAMIALASGITGIGIAKAKDFGSLLGSVHVFDTNTDRNASFSILIVITYCVAGFFFMYFVRKLALNPALAEARSAMDRIQISRDVSAVAARIIEKLPQSLIFGREFIGEVEELGPEEEKRLREILYGDDVNQFLEECMSDAQNGLITQPQNVAMAAQLHYYRVYFEKEGTDARDTQETRALDWIQRALMRDPTDPNLQIKLADIYGMRGRYGEAVSILEKLERDDKSPQYIEQWLGYFLLFVDGREDDAIRHSMSYHKKIPDESSGLFNAACGYAQLYTIELQREGVDSLPYSTNRIESLRLLQRGIRADSDLRALAVKHSDEHDSFESLKKDEEFIKVTTAPSK